MIAMAGRRQPRLRRDESCRCLQAQLHTAELDVGCARVENRLGSIDPQKSSSSQIQPVIGLSYHCDCKLLSRPCEVWVTTEPSTQTKGSMPIINSQTPDFRVQAYHGDDFVEVSTADTRSHWSVFFLLPGRLYLCVPNRTWRPG